MIRPITSADSSDILKINRPGLETRNTTFENIVPAWIGCNTKLYTHSRFAFVAENRIVSWAAIAQYSSSKVYQGIAEKHIYVHPDFTGKGIGSLLLENLLIHLRGMVSGPCFQLYFQKIKPRFNFI